MNWHSGAAGTVGASQLQGPRLDPELMLIYVRSLACSPSVPVGFLQVLWLPLTSQKHNYAKLSLGVNEPVNLCVHSVRVYSHLFPSIPGIGFGSTSIFNAY